MDPEPSFFNTYGHASSSFLISGVKTLEKEEAMLWQKSKHVLLKVGWVLWKMSCYYSGRHASSI